MALTELWFASRDEVVGNESSAGTKWIPVLDALHSGDFSDYAIILRLASIPEWLIRQLSAPIGSHPIISVELNL